MKKLDVQEVVSRYSNGYTVFDKIDLRFNKIIDFQNHKDNGLVLTVDKSLKGEHYISLAILEDLENKRFNLAIFEYENPSHSGSYVNGMYITSNIAVKGAMEKRLQMTMKEIANAIKKLGESEEDLQLSLFTPWRGFKDVDKPLIKVMLTYNDHTKADILEHYECDFVMTSYAKEALEYNIKAVLNTKTFTDLDFELYDEDDIEDDICAF